MQEQDSRVCYEWTAAMGLVLLMGVVFLFTKKLRAAFMHKLHVDDMVTFGDSIYERRGDGPDCEEGAAREFASAADEETAASRSILRRFGGDQTALASMLKGSSLDDLEFGQCIGRGASSMVYSADWKGNKVALKHMKLGMGCDTTAAQAMSAEFAAEVKIMSKLSHPNVIHYVGFTTEPQCLIIQELASGGDLHSYLKSFGVATQPQLLAERPGLGVQTIMALDIARGMEYLHMQTPTILHRDLKTPNLLLDGNLRVKITDFGISREKQVSHGETGLMTVCGTPLWTAPEILRGMVYNEKAEVYSFALCLWEIFSFSLPFADLGLGQMEVVLKVASEEIRPAPPAGGLPTFFKELIEQCWAVEPSQRPGFHRSVAEIVEFATGASIAVDLPVFTESVYRRSAAEARQL